MMNSKTITIHSLVHDLKVPLAVIELVIHSLLTKKVNFDHLNNQQISILKTVREINLKAKHLTNRLLDSMQFDSVPHCFSNDAHQKPLMELYEEGSSPENSSLDHLQEVLNDLKRRLFEIENQFFQLKASSRHASDMTIDQRRPLDRALRNCRTARKLIENATTILASDRLEIHREDVKLSEVLVRSLIEVFDLKQEFISEGLQKIKTLNEVKSICIEQDVILHIDDHLWEKKFCLDRERMNQVIVNLLLNAFKFRMKIVEISAHQKAEHLILSIKDDGQGLVPVADNQKESLDIEHQSAPCFPVRGHGFGLLAVQTILQEIGGLMMIEASRGQGAKFTITIP